jgi:hypothetical protein
MAGSAMLTMVVSSTVMATASATATTAQYRRGRNLRCRDAYRFTRAWLPVFLAL